MRLYLFFLLLIFVFQFFPTYNNVFAQDNVELKEIEVKLLLGSINQKLEDEWVVSEGKDQAIIVIIQQAVRADLARYFLLELPKDTAKDFLKMSINLARILVGDETAVVDVIKEIEKKSVDVAKEYAIDWLLQNEIKIGTGSLDLIYPGIDGKTQRALFSYIIEQKPIDSKYSEVVIEFHSPDTIKAPALVAGYQWEGGIVEIPSFIFRAKGKVLKTEFGAYRWIEGPDTEIIFNEPVPRIEAEKKGFLESWKDKIVSWAEEIKKIISVFNDLFKRIGSQAKEEIISIWRKIGGFFAKINPFVARVGPQIGYFNELEDDFENSFEEFTKMEQEREQEQSSSSIGTSLEEMQNMIDDISERIDILNRDMNELMPKEKEKSSKDSIEAGLALQKEGTEEKEELEETIEDQKIVFVPPTDTNSADRARSFRVGGGGSTHPAEPSWCSISGGAARDKIIFSEIAWMGSVESSSNEWIRLKNISNSAVNLENWQIFDKAKQIKIILDIEDNVEAGEIYLLERTDDNSLPNVPADRIYAGALNDTDEALYLFDSNCILQDFVEANPDWPAGDKDSKETMKRNNDFTWYDYPDSIIEIESDSNNDGIGKEEEEEPEPESGVEHPSYSVLINEVAWMGTKSSAADEWIELFNTSSEPVDMSDWQLIFEPITGGPRIIALKNDTPIVGALSYFLMERTNDTTISDTTADYIYTGALNDECISLELRDSVNNLIDKIVCLENNWPAGKKEGRISMERAGLDNWYFNNLIIHNGKDSQGNDIWGTPKAKNSVSISPTEIIRQLPFDEFDEIVLSPISAPYILKEKLIVPEGKTLIIEPGVILKFFGEYHGLAIGGTLKAIGGGESKILFTSFQEDPAPGDWDKIHFTGTSLNSELNNVIVEYAGGGFGTSCSPSMAGIKIEETDSILIKNSTFKHNQARGIYALNSSGVFDNIQVENTVPCDSLTLDYAGNGIYVEYGGSPKIQNSLIKNNPIGIMIHENTFPIIENNIFEQNEKPIFVYNGYPYFAGNKAQDNDIDGVYMRGNINHNTSWQADLPYIVGSKIIVFDGSTLTLDPGTVVRFYNEYSGMAIGGNLRANDVLFTSFQEDPAPGDWDKIHFTGTSLNSELNNVIVEYAGGGFGTSCSPSMAGILVEQGIISLTGSIIRHNQYNGVKFIGSDSILNSVAINNTAACVDNYSYGGFGLYIDGGSPFLENLSFENNDNCNMYMNGECYVQLAPPPEPLPEEPPPMIQTETPSNNP